MPSLWPIFSEDTKSIRFSLLSTIILVVISFTAGWFARASGGRPQPVASIVTGRVQPPALPYQVYTAARLVAEGTAHVTATLPAWVFAQPSMIDTTPGSRDPPTGALKGLATAQDYEDVDLHSVYFAGVRGGLILETGALVRTPTIVRTPTH
jgi:hypothetical protein